MTANFKPIDVHQITDNCFKLIAEDWMLVTGGDISSFNTMTASWGTFGELWNRKICICFVRPTRYTYEFMEKHEYFTLSFFEEKYRDILKFCGTKSGRDYDKIKETGLTPQAGSSGAVYFGEARLVLECRKIYYHDLNPEFFQDQTINKEYSLKDYHRMYIGEIMNCLTR